MSDMFWEGDPETQARPESNAMRVLREKAEADSKRLNDMADQINVLTGALNAERVEKVVTSKGYDAKVVAALTEAGLPADPKAVEAFLTKHGDLFVKGQTTNEPADTVAADGVPVVPGDEQAALQAQAAAAAGAMNTTGVSALENQMRGAANADELMKVIRGSGL